MSSRRDFLRQAMTSAAAISLGSIIPSFGVANGVTGGSSVGANDKIRLGVIGVNSRGRALASGFARMPGCEVTHLCDVDAQALERCQGDIYNITGKKPEGVKDLRRLMENKDIDGVVIALPDHWHAPAAIMALQAGKHVYLEKPTSHNPAENELLVKAAAKYGKVVQVGNQRRSWPNVQAAINEIHSGAIGDVHYAKSWYVNNRPSIGVGNVVPVPEHIDWDLWQGPAPRVADFKDNYLHYNWHWFWHWGTGEALNNGTHFVDILRWGLDVEYPTLVSSVGGRYNHTHDDWECPDTQMITFQFGDKATCSWEGRSCNSTPVDGSGVGTAFYGDKGTIFITGGNEYRLVDMKGDVVKDVKSNLAFEQGNLLNPSDQLDMIHFQNWFDAIRKGEKLNSGIVDACISTQLVQLGNISQRVGRALRIDPSNGRIIGDKEAMKLYSRSYEKGWEPKV